MGQRIVLRAKAVIGDVALFDTDRTFGGQDGESFGSAAEAREAISFSGRLAERIFDADPSVTNVFVQSNQVSVARDGGWDDTGGIGSVIEQFFIHYAHNR